MKKFIILAALIAPLITHAANWVDIGTTNDNNLQMFLDFDSVQPYTKRVPLAALGSAFMSGFVQHTYINDNKLRKDGYYYAKHLYIVDCDNRSFYSPAYIIYGFKDQVMDSYQDKYYTIDDFKIAFPETMASSIVSSICYERPPRSQLPKFNIEDLL